MKKADVRIGERYVYDGCTAPGSIVTVVGEPRTQFPDGWVVNGVTENCPSIGAYRTRYLQPTD